MFKPIPVKRAEPDHPVLDVFTVRYSPYVFEPRGVETDKLLSCLEAARWSASSFNEQPWSYIIARREDGERFEKLLGCLVEANQAWAKNAGVLMLSVVKRTFTKNNKPNRVCEHDVGLAAQNLTVQATELGLAVHQMAGINQSVARQTYNIPDGYDPFTGIAIGYAADPDKADDQDLADRDRQPRKRKPLSEFIFADQWGQSAELTGGG